jgi:phosphoglycolate phosphatase
LRIPAWKLALIAMHARRRARDSSAFTLFPGAQELVGALADHGIPVAIVSSNARDVVARALGPETSRLISAWSCGAAMFGKARHFRSVIRKTRVDPQRVVGVGDETRDIEAARQVGITAAAVTWGFAPAGILQASGPDYLFSRFSDLQDFLLAQANG